jgi:hypothetical protein
MATYFTTSNGLKRKELFVLGLCLLISFTLRYYTFDQKSLWVDEIHTFKDSIDGVSGRLKFYQEEPTYLHPPLFFVLTHFFHPFSKPERDLRIFPLIFGTLSIPFFFFLSRLFSPPIAPYCALSLAFTTFHICLSQDGRPYSMIMFLGMVSLFFLMKYLKTLKKGNLLLVAVCYALLFYTSYSSILFIAFSQILWLYKTDPEVKPLSFSSFVLLNGLFLLLCLPWILFLGINYKSHPIMNPLEVTGTGSLGSILYGILHDWVPFAPLMFVSAILLILFPLVSIRKKNSLLLLATLLLPGTTLYFFCKGFHITHFVSSRYFMSFLPLFVISLYLSLEAFEARFEKLGRWARLKFLFLILLIASNLVILPLYYRSEKQDFRGLVTYLKNHLREGDKIFIGSIGYIPGILHYFEAYPEDRHHIFGFRNDPEKDFELGMNFVHKNRIFTIYQSKTCCAQYVADGSRLWIIVGKDFAKEIEKGLPSGLKAYFDGSFANFGRLPTDESIYLFLWDPLSPDEKGIQIP